MDGLDMIEALRAMPGFAKTPVVILSTRTDEPTINRAQGLGVVEFLSKRRFEQKKLKELLNRILTN